MNPKAALNTLLALLLVIAVAAGAFAVRAYNKAIETAALVPDLQRQIDSFANAQKEVVQRASFDAEVRTKRAASSHRIETVSREDSDDGAYLRERIPDRVRDAARTR